MAVGAGAGEVFVALDLEMTGTRPDLQEVVEVAAVKFRGERVLGTFSRLVRPRASLAYGVQVLTGIHPADLAKAPPLSEVAPLLTNFVAGFPIVGQSVANDIACLARQGVHLANPLFDTFDLATVLLPQLESYGLGALVEHFGISFPKQHRAAADALATMRLFGALVERVFELDPAVVREIDRLIAPFDWPLKALFCGAAAAHSREDAQGAASIREALLAKVANDLPLEVLMLAPAAGEPLAEFPAPERHSRVDLSRAVGHLAGSQVDGARMVAEAIADALTDGDRLCLEIGPGIDRPATLALSAAASALDTGRPVLLVSALPRGSERLRQATASLPLETCLVGADDLRVASVRPRESYLCLMRWSALRRRGARSLSEALTLTKTLVWLSKTSQGDVAELNLTPDERATWRRVAAADGCGLDVCPFAERGVCFVERARRAAAAAHVVTTDVATLVAEARSNEPLLPARYDLLVDDAHRLEDEATDAAGLVLAESTLGAALDVCDAALDVVAGLADSGAVEPALAASVVAARELVSACASAGRSLLGVLGGVVRATAAGRGRDSRLRINRAARERAEWAAVVTATASLVAAATALGDAAGPLADDLEASGGAESETAARGVLATTVCFERLVESAESALAGADANLVVWVAETQTGYELRAAPVRVAVGVEGVLHRDGVATVLASSTLAVGGSFGFVQERLGFEHSKTLAVHTDDERVAAFAPTDIGEPDTPAQQAGLTRLVDECAMVGKTLVLCTSHTQIRAIYHSLHASLGQRGVLVIGQGVDGSSRRNQLNSFRSTERSVFIATGLNWEDPEVADAAPRIVVVTRLPFPPSNSPVVAARTEGQRDPLGGYTLPSALLRFRQGGNQVLGPATALGHRGAIVVADGRALTKAYAPAAAAATPGGVLRALPAREVATAVREWLSG